MFYTKLDSPLCEIYLVGDEEGLSQLHLDTGRGKRTFAVKEEWVRNDPFFASTAEQIREYFAGERTRFEVVLNPRGTDFQRRVWEELRKIPYGAVATYKDIARGIGRERAVRAVGAANGRNPIPLIIPCHRVIGTNGKLTGFAHGLEIKGQLLELER